MHSMCVFSTCKCSNIWLFKIIYIGTNNDYNNQCIHNIYYIILNTHGRFAIAFLPLTTRLSTELFEAVFIEKSSG